MTEKRVEIVIGGKTDASLRRSTAAATTAMERFAAAQAKAAARRDLYNNSIQSARSLQNAYRDAATQTAALSREMKAGGAASAEQVAAFNASRAAARQAKTEFLAVGTAVAQMQGRAAASRGSFAAFDAIASGAARAAPPVRSLGLAWDDLERKQARAILTGSRAAGALRQPTGAKLTGPLGLRPYELQNLGYQVNDLITQIASGTSPMQAFAQQGGQIAQIFPKATGAIIRFVPILAIAAAALAPFISALMKTNSEAARMSAVEGILARSGEAATYAAPNLVRVAEGFEEIGIKGKDATDVLGIFVRDAVDPAYLREFGEVSAGLAKILGTDVTTAAEKVSTAFTGNADAILALDDELNFLTDSERKHIEALRESKKDAEARTEAFEIFASKYGAIASDMEGPWTGAVKNLGAAWEAFVDYVNFIDWSKVKNEINGLIGLVEKLTSILPGARNRTYTATTSRINFLEQERVGVIGRLPTGTSRNDQRNRQGGEARLKILEDELAVLRQRQAGQELLEGISGITTPQAKPADTTRDAPPPAARTPRARRSGKSDAERQAEAQDKYLASLLAENEARQFQLSLLDETERQQAVLTALREAEIAAQKVGLTLTDDQKRALIDSVTALYDGEKAQEASRKIEQARLDLAQQRGEIEGRNAFITRMVAGEMQGATEDQRRVYADILGQQYDREASLRRQQVLEKSVSDQQAIQSELVQQIEAANAAGDTSRVAQLREQLIAVNGQLREAVQQILAFWRTQSGPEADAMILKWSGLDNALETAGSRAVITGQQLANMLAGGATNALADFFGHLEQGEKIFPALSRAFRKYAADFLAQIAQMILMQTVLNALGYGGSAPGAGATDGLAGIINGLFKTKHSGGLVSSGSASRRASPGIFAGAHRFHTGGVVGLGPDEVPIIAKRQEEVLTQDDPRHRNNGGLKQGGRPIKVVNVFDPGDMLDKGLATEAGEQALFNMVGRNAGAFRALLEI